ncbi:hypothetical protein QUF58_09610 [Anaerolineales bacterium HSG24]|nr:hypothetical protein [Anaerolineales bacterium HSG24]
MLMPYFSPLAPSAFLLLSALILPFLTRSRRATISQFGPLFLTVVTALIVATTQLNSPDTIVQWQFSDFSPSYQLTAQLTPNQLPFLLVLVLLLFIIILANIPLETSAPLGTRPNSSWFLLGSGASAMFVSTSPLALSYAVILFDLWAAFYWFRQRQTDLGIARLFLTGLTVLSLILIMIQPSDPLAVYLLTGTIWLRLILYPLFELHGRQASDDGEVIYFGISVMVGLYLALNLLNQPLPASIRWLTIAILLLNGIIIWLSAISDQTINKLSLIRIVVPLGGLTLLIVPATLKLTIYALMLPLALAVLWITANLGRVSSQRLRYLPGAVATISLIGLPSTFGWLVLPPIYEMTSSNWGVPTLIGIILCLGLSFSYLVTYWQTLWFAPLNNETEDVAENEAENEDETESTPADTELISNMAIGAIFISMIPLLPLIGQLGLSRLTGLTVPSLIIPTTETLVAVGLFWLLAAGAGYYRLDIVYRLNIPVETLNQILTGGWLTWLLSPLGRLDKFTLQLQVILEGKHYMAWVFFIALVGGLTFLLQ